MNVFLMFRSFYKYHPYIAGCNLLFGEYLLDQVHVPYMSRESHVTHVNKISRILWVCARVVNTPEIPS